MDIEIIDPQVIIQDRLDQHILKNLERYGRICYKSESRITEDSAARFIQNILKSGHESVIEHEKITVIFVTNRGITHEIVRHRIASYSQESTRYCNYRNKMVFIRPYYFPEGSEAYEIWKETVSSAARAYRALLAQGARPEQARGVLPADLKSEIVVTYNLREWRHFFKLRCSRAAHPQMRQIAIPTLLEFRKSLPVIFDDIEYDIDIPMREYAAISYA
ncbi:MAG: FAD-dependent thymidylate synthase [Desulfitobacteriaceae bacterium]|nr:FAD-dependent thymidylate synthase [Desulfitobacteriaceae bacterium]